VPTIIAGGGAALLLAAATVGCDRAQTRKAIVLNPTPRTTTAPVVPATATAAATEPASRPSTTQAAKKSHMKLDTVWVDFPAAKLILTREGDRTRALLCSNDPPEVISPTYQGNRYSFEMMLDGVDDVRNIGAAEFFYRAASMEIQETPNGIFLDGDRQHLQPYDIRVTFDRKEDGTIVAEINGTFVVQAKGTLVGQQVQVYAPNLSAKPDLK
jgi:hypothetical protein